MEVWFLLPVVLVVAVSIMMTIFSLRHSLFHSSSEWKERVGKDAIATMNERPSGVLSGNVSSLLAQSDEREKPVPSLSLSAASSASSCPIWLPPGVRSEPARSPQAIIYPPPLSRSPYASSFNQRQEDLVATEYKNLAFYKHGVQMYYDKKLSAFFLVFTNFAFRDMKDIESYCKMIYDDTVIISKEQGLEKMGVLVDLTGLEVGGGITPLWGQEVKKHVSTCCTSSINGESMFVAYFNQAVKTDQAYIKRKMMQVQMQTEAVKNNFKCNICATKEEAVAYYRHLATANRR